MLIIAVICLSIQFENKNSAAWGVALFYVLKWLNIVVAYFLRKPSLSETLRLKTRCSGELSLLSTQK